MAGPGAGQPDGRAHRLQRGVRAAVRARPGGHRGGVPPGPGPGPAADAVLPAGAGGRRGGRPGRPGPRPGDRLGRLPGRRGLGAGGGRPPGARRLHRHRLRRAGRRRAVLLGRARVRDRAGADLARPAWTCPAPSWSRSPAGRRTSSPGCRPASWTSPRRCSAGPGTRCCSTAARWRPPRCRSTRPRPGPACCSSTPGPGTSWPTGSTAGGGPSARRPPAVSGSVHCGT